MNTEYKCTICHEQYKSRNEAEICLKECIESFMDSSYIEEIEVELEEVDEQCPGCGFINCQCSLHETHED